MRLPEACFNSKIGEAFRIDRFNKMKYVARIYTRDDSTFEIMYKRYNEFGNEYEDIVNIEGSSNKRLLVSTSDRFDTRGGGEVIDGPETLANRTEIKVDLNFVILYESLIPSLSGYLLAFSYAINHIKNIQEHKPGARLYLKPS